jgi:iron(III) transport system permease protein
VRPNSLYILTVGVASCVALPLFVILSFLLNTNSDVWGHLVDTLLWRYVSNTLILSFLVSVGVVFIGVPAAWIIAFYRFPGRTILSWLLLLPMAYPAYILAYTYTGVLEYAGPILSWMRAINAPEWSMLPFLHIRSLPGAALMLSLVLYPYVYLLARAAFLEQSANLMEAGYMLGQNRFSVLRRIVIPMARPAIAAGTLLAIMETVADFGTVQFFGVQTLTTGIIRTYYGFGDTPGAAQLSSLLLGFVAVLMICERNSRNRVRYYSDQTRRLDKASQYLRGFKALAAQVACLIPILLGFLIPTLLLMNWTMFDAQIQSLWQLAWNSFALAGGSSLLIVAVALIVAYANRLFPSRNLTHLTTFIGLGYALPGVVVAIGVLISFGTIDAWISGQLATLGVRPQLWLSGTLVAVIFAYLVRFLAVANGNIVSGLSRIRPSLDQSGRLLGLSQRRVLTEVHIPLMRSSVLTALLVCFVDVLKELPATLILRPFDFNTLAVRAYELAGQERLIDAAPASLCIVLVGLLPVVLLNRSIGKL